MNEILKQLDWTHLVQFFGFVVSFVLAQGGMVTIIDKIKTTFGARFNLTGKRVTFLVVALVTLWTIANMTVQGLITPEALTAANVVGTFLFVLERTQAEYLRVRKLENEQKINDEG